MVSIPHRSSAVGGKTAAVKINHVDVHGPECATFFGDASTFIEQGIKATIKDFVGRNLSLRVACGANLILKEVFEARIGSTATLLVVFIPARASFPTTSA
jgi:hypothetical protein